MSKRLLAGLLLTLGCAAAACETTSTLEEPPVIQVKCAGTVTLVPVQDLAK